MSEPIVENTMIGYTKGEKVTPIAILSERKIGEGTFGTVYEADVLVHERNRKFIIKRFKDIEYPLEKSTAQENATRAIANYHTAKKAGLKVFTTYRLGEDGISILMTNGNSESTICVSNDPMSQLPAFGEPKIRNITNDKVEALTKKILKQAFLASEQGISINNDAFFFLVDKKTKEIDFVFGDLDNVNQRPLGSQSIIVNNLYWAQSALTNFIYGNVESPGEYADIVSNMCWQARKEQG